ncbi:MAG: 16S rRNA (cytosine(967)-C(5))-methyltransferase RsmB [Xanthomonadaceae bacterium]|nr:16S rRNA (cytosine(967)-C(5))-methyltransferase RsmB [Xanthomonadaceae bacterium]
MPPGVPPRMTAARVLDAVIHRGRSLKTELNAALPLLPDTRDRALAEAICFTALRRRPCYEAALAHWLQKPLGRGNGVLNALLYVGFAQLDTMNLPAHAALSATVDTARALGFPRQAGLVNALLRRAQRERFPSSDPSAAWPEWLRTRVLADWPQQADSLFSTSLAQAPVWLRINRRQGSRDDYAQKLRAAGIHAVSIPELPDGLRLDTPVAITLLPGFAEGAVSIQDGSAQQVADALRPPPGAHVLDACAAPGGKAAHLLERDSTLRLTVLDIDARRLVRVRDTFERLRLPTTAQMLAADATDLPVWWDGEAFDAILLDAPCSATGVVRRQPDILLHRRPADLDALLNLQARLLDALWRTLKPEGTLVYTTCSILKAENEIQATAFLARTPDAQAEPLGPAFGCAAGPGRQRFTGESGMDGFFYARFRKLTGIIAHHV